jgi:hypothetical protein
MAKGKAPDISPELELQLRLKYRKDPYAWCVERFGVDPRTIEWSLNPEYESHSWDSAIRLPGKDEWRPCKDPLKTILDAVGMGVRRIAIPSSVSTGKTFLLKLLTFWFLDVYPGRSEVYTLAAKEKQLSIGLWKEIGNSWVAFKQLRPTAMRNQLDLYMNQQADKEAREIWSAHGVTAGAGAEEESAARIQGIHAPNILFLLEETPGISRAVINGIYRTATAKNNIVVAVGNPNGETDELNRIMQRRSTLCVRISSLDHPNYVMDDGLFIPGAVTRESVQEVLEEPDVAGDVEHPAYLSRVRGITPIASGRCLFPVQALTAIRDANTVKDGSKFIWKTMAFDKTVLHRGECDGRTTIYDDAKVDYYNRYILGVDVSGDTMTGDHHAAIVYDRVGRRVVAVARLRGAGDYYAKELVRLATAYRVPDARPGRGGYSWPLMAWETNGVGLLQRTEEFKKYPRLYHKASLETDRAKVRRAIGWNTNPQTRPSMIAALRSWCPDLTADGTRVPDEDLYTEMKAFCENDRGRVEAVSGYHDDLVMALAIALVVDQEHAIRGDIPVKRDEDVPKVAVEPFRVRPKKVVSGTPGFRRMTMPRSFAA